MAVIGLLRTYHPQGTNGEIWLNGELVCYSIELPWLDNIRNISCIPEGTYSLSKRYSKRFSWHILVEDVPQRSGILFHPANDARKELRGCIAPVSQQTGIGKGSNSKVAFEKLRMHVYALLDIGERVYLQLENKEES